MFNFEIMEINYIKRDLNRIKKYLGANFKRASIFGSFLKNQNNANDIDIAIQVNSTICEDKFVQFINENMGDRTERVTLNSYGPKNPIKFKRMLYDFVLIDKNHSNGLFMELNKDNLTQIL